MTICVQGELPETWASVALIWRSVVLLRGKRNALLSTLVIPMATLSELSKVLPLVSASRIRSHSPTALRLSAASRIVSSSALFVRGVPVTVRTSAATVASSQDPLLPASSAFWMVTWPPTLKPKVMKLVPPLLVMVLLPVMATLPGTP